MGQVLIYHRNHCWCLKINLCFLQTLLFYFLTFPPLLIDPKQIISCSQCISYKNSKCFICNVIHLPSKCTCCSFTSFSFPAFLLLLTHRRLNTWISYNLLIFHIFIYQIEAQVFPSAMVCKQCQLGFSPPSLGQSRERCAALQLGLTKLRMPRLHKRLIKQSQWGERKRANYQAAAVNQKGAAKCILKSDN